MKDQFTKYNIDVNFIRNKKHELGGIYGCFEAHIQCITDAYNNNLDYCLVFEDDCKIYSNFKDSINIVEEYISNPKSDANIFYLQNRGLLYLSKKINSHLYYGKSGGTSCILITKQFMKTILDTYEEHLGVSHYDRYLNIVCKNSIICLKYIVKSAPFGSDNTPWGNNKIMNFHQFNNKHSPQIEEFLQLLSVSISKSVLLTKSSRLKNIYINFYKKSYV
jgi:GR25 family glycosyltransferase involved in LPS biosynthesis